jgi:adenylate cyclase
MRVLPSYRRRLGNPFQYMRSGLLVELLFKIVKPKLLTVSVRSDLEMVCAGPQQNVQLAVYDLFMRGRELSWHATKSNSIEARHLLGRAVTISPDFAAAHSLIGATCVNDYANGWAEIPEQSLQTALDIAERAVQLDEADPQAHEVLAMALFFHRELDRALAEARRCLGLAPNSAGGHVVIARILTYSGDAAGAINMIDANMRLDPLYRDLTLHFLAEARVSLGQFDAAVTALKQRLERNPNGSLRWLEIGT